MSDIPVLPAVSLLAGPGAVIEVRALAENATYSGYFTDQEALAAAAEALDTDPSVHGIYMTLNPVNPALLARRANRMKRMVRGDAATSDADILSRRWLPVDIDPVRPSGVSSTGREHALSLAKADGIARHLSSLGFPEPVRGDSGNGAHLLFRIDLPNDEASLQLVKQCLSVLDLIFSDEAVLIDGANYNAGRIWKLYGTMARKGDSTPERPHRRSRIISAPEAPVAVTREQLMVLAGRFPEEPLEAGTGSPQRGIDPAVWLPAHGIPVRSQKPYRGGMLFVPEQCPFSPAHKDGAFVIRFRNGGVFAGCHHTSCGGGKQRWRELVEKYETAEEKRQRMEGRIHAWQRERMTGKIHREEYGDVSGSAGDPAGTARQNMLPPPVPPGSDTPGNAPGEPAYPLTDAGNGERLVQKFGSIVRFCAPFGAWYIWNGKIWERDEAGCMLVLATGVARSIHTDAARAGSVEQARTLSRFALLAESLRSRKAMIDSAAPLAAIHPSAFDAHPHLFNCTNGTLDLITLSFREHRAADMLTKMASVTYDPDATCPQWLAHLDLIFAGDAEYIAGFQSMCGYSLLGTNPRQVMFILYGRGRNGKSRTIEVLARILAGYAVNIASESLMAKRFETARSDLARLAGARLATASEGTEGARMDESVIKQITGEYAITVRKLYENEFEFTPSAKIWLTTNHEPVIRGTDDGIWRRIWMVPFSVQIPEERCDPDIAAKLLSESSGILNWCLAGLSRYYGNDGRLMQPRKVSAATVNLRTVSDTVGLFLATECVFEPGAGMSRVAFMEMFQKWCEEEGVRGRISARKLAGALREKGVVEGPRIGFDRSWSGVRQKTLEEKEAYERDHNGQATLAGLTVS